MDRRALYRALVQDTLTWLQGERAGVGNAPIHERTTERAQPSRPQAAFAPHKVLRNASDQLKLTHAIPSDEEARRVSQGWKWHLQGVDAILLSATSSTEEKQFLETLARAICQKLRPAQLIDALQVEADVQWEAFFRYNRPLLFLGFESVLRLPRLIAHYKELPSQGLRLLHNTPLKVLEPASHYLRNPALKRSLWEWICLRTRT